MDAQIGNLLGVTAVGPGSAIIAEITADGINTVTVSAADFRKFRLGQVVSILVKSSGAVLASNRTITAMDSATNILTYSGADVAAVAGTHSIYPGETADVNSYNIPRSNLNGGPDEDEGFSIGAQTIGQMRARLQAINATTYSDAQLNKMTFNDCVYALRINDFASSIR